MEGAVEIIFTKTINAYNFSSLVINNTLAKVKAYKYYAYYSKNISILFGISLKNF